MAKEDKTLVTGTNTDVVVLQESLQEKYKPAWW
jgi:hypothetical protein